MYKIICPHCGRETGIVNFGRGYVAACCDTIIYNSDKLPPQPNEEEVSVGDTFEGYPYGNTILHDNK